MPADEERLLKAPPPADDALSSSGESVDSRRSPLSPAPAAPAASRWSWNAILAMVTLLLVCLGFVAGALGHNQWRLGSFNSLDQASGQRYESEGWYTTPRGGTVGSWSQSYKKAALLVERMSLIDKINITTGTGWAQGPCVGNTGPATTVGFPSLCLQDGPLGLRFADNSTAFPAGLTTAATWNPTLMYMRGAAHGREARGKGIHVILGPAMGPLGRMPCGGRNWEGFGPDPFLQGVAASETIRGIQDQHVIATAKHYILQEQEHFRDQAWGTRDAVSSNVDDRTLHELYLWPFAESVRAGVASVMCSYQMSNNTYTCENSKLLNGVLKDELGFQGFIQSDWLAARSGVHAALAGLDVTMPGEGLKWANGNPLWGHELTRAVMNETIPMERLNDMVLRVVAAWYQLGQDDKTMFPPEGPNFSSWTDDEEGFIYFGSVDAPGETDRSRETGLVNKYEKVRADHYKVARQVAAEGTVLVKNSGILPLKRGAFSGKKVGIYGEDAGPTVSMEDGCQDRACNKGTLPSGWGSGSVRVAPYLTDPLSALSRAFNTSEQDLPSFDSVLDNTATPAVAKSAKKQDLCFAFINSVAGEGYLVVGNIRGDRNDLFANKNGDQLVKTVANNCDNTIVVVHAVGPVVVEKWIDLPGVKAVLFAHLPGEESGNALVELLFGDRTPSGKLPYTLGKKLEDYGPTAGILYKKNDEVTPQQTFSEGLEVDYRYFDKHGIEPRFPFGYGLSYTTFQLSSPQLTEFQPKSAFPSLRPDGKDPPSLSTQLPPVEEVLWPDSLKDRKVSTFRYIYPYLESANDITTGPYPYPPAYKTPRPKSEAGGGEGGNPDLFAPMAQVEITVRNTGNTVGQEVVQLYVGFPDGVVDGNGTAVDFPVRVLRGFQKIELQPQQEEVLRFSLRRKDLSWWDVRAQNWHLPTEGNFTFWIGNSSRSLEHKVEW